MPFQVNIQANGDDSDESRHPLSGNSPFESFLTAAFGTLLAVLLAWRFLLSPDSSIAAAAAATDDDEQQQQQSTSKHASRKSANSISLGGGSSTFSASTSTATTTAASTVVQPCRGSSDLDSIKNEFDNRHAHKTDGAIYSSTTASNVPSSSSATLLKNSIGESSIQRPLTVQRFNSDDQPPTRMSSSGASASDRSRLEYLDIDNNNVKMDASSIDMDALYVVDVPPCLHNYSVFQMNDDNDEVLVVHGDDDIKSDSSSSERCELGVLPAYLDTITEEDTDDLNTNSSGRSSPNRLGRIVHIQEDLRRARDSLSGEIKDDIIDNDNDDDEKLSTTTSSSTTSDITAQQCTPKNSNSNLNYFTTVNTSCGVDQEHNRVRYFNKTPSPPSGDTAETGPLPNSPRIFVDATPTIAEDWRQPYCEKVTSLDDDDDTSRPNLIQIDSINADELLGDKSRLTEESSLSEGSDEIESTAQCCNLLDAGANADNKRLNNKSSTSARVIPTLHSSVAPLSVDDYSLIDKRSFDTLLISPSTMEYDLRKAASRFERYGHIYRDAPKSGMEEFDPKSLENQIRQAGSGSANTSLNTTLNTSDDKLLELLNRRSVASADDNNNPTSGAAVGGKGGGKLSTSIQMSSSENANGAIASLSKNTNEKTVVEATGRASSQSGPTFQRRPATSTTTVGASTTTTTTTETKTTIHSSPLLLSPTCGVCGGKVYQSSDFKCRHCVKHSGDTNNTNNNSPPKKLATNFDHNKSKPIVPEAQLDDFNSNWSFSDDEMSSTSTNGGKYSRGGLVMATATSKAIITDPAGQKRTSLIAAASSSAVSKNPYMALARATASAASKVSEVVQHAVDPDQQGKVSLVVSSTVCATGKDLKRASRENVFEVDYSSQEEETPESMKKRYLNGNSAHSSPVHWGDNSTKLISPRRSPEPAHKGRPSSHGASHRRSPETSAKNGRSLSATTPDKLNRSYRREEVKSGYEPQPERIYPPSPLRQVDIQRKVVSPQRVSSDHLQKLIEDPYFTKASKHQRENQAAGEISKQKSSPTTTTKPIPLSERNVNLWSTLPENTPNNKQNLMRWRNSMNLTENEELRQLMENDRKKEEQMHEAKAKRKQQDEDKAEKIRRMEARLVYEQQKKSQDELNEEIRKIRRNKYKAKIDKAKKDYLASKASISDLYKDPDEFEKKFNVSIENVRLPDAPRGPYLEYLGKTGSLHQIKVADVKPFYFKPDSHFDDEYESIVKQAERLWAPYKRREHAPNAHLYTNGRSTGYLETNFDANTEDYPPVDYGGGVYETDLDEAIRENEQRQREHESRSRTKSMSEVKKKSRGEPVPSSKEQQESHARARSVDYLVDKRAREEVEPPENQLKKILGDNDKDETELSEHELRFRKSTEKLAATVPDWYLNSDYCPPKKYDGGGSRKSTPTYADRSFSPEISSPEPVNKFPSHERSRSSPSEQQKYLKRNQSPSLERRDSPVTKPKQPNEHTRYVSPWTYGGKIAPPPGADKPKSPEPMYKYEGHKPVPPARGGYQPSGTGPPRSISEPRYVVESDTSAVSAYEKSQRTLITTQIEKSYKTITSSSSTKSFTSTTGADKQQKSDMFLPKDFFAKYKDEIEELRKSRSNLYGRQTNESNSTILYQTPDEDVPYIESGHSTSQSQGYSVPVATVRPSNHFKSRPPPDTSSLTSTDISSAPGTPTPPNVYQTRNQRPSPQRYITPQQPIRLTESGLMPMEVSRTNESNSRRMSDEFSDSEIVTSTPFSAKKLPYQENRHYTPAQFQQPRHMQGWTVSAVPDDWNVPGKRESVVIEVSDQFFDSAMNSHNKKNTQAGAPLTLEEYLDSLLNLPTQGQRRLETLDESSASLEKTPVLPRSQMSTAQLGNMGIYTHNGSVMDQCRKSPERAESLLKRETLWVRCAHCDKVRQISEAKYRYVSCHHCYTYYCSRPCRKNDWAYHKEQCNYARINTICKDIIFKVRIDPEAQWQMSRVARQSYAVRGRGSVNFRFRSPYLAQKYVKGGWNELTKFPGNYLIYCTVPELVDAKKEPNLVNLCRRYDPQSKFVLSVSIMAEIEEVPETPPPEREQALIDAQRREMEEIMRDEYEVRRDQFREIEDDSHRFERSRSVPNNKRKAPNDDAKTLLKSVLRSMEHIAPGPIYISSAQRTANSVLSTPNQSFDRGDQGRHTVTGSGRQMPGHYNSSPMVWSGPSIAAGNEDADETEV